jgi:hypothetical protein
MAGKVSADSRFYAEENSVGLETRGTDGYVPDPYEARDLNRGRRVRRRRWQKPDNQRMVQKLRSPPGREVYRRRKAIVEPVFGVLKQQPDLRRFRLGCLAKVTGEVTLAATAFNLMRMWRTALLPRTRGEENSRANPPPGARKPLP